MEPKIKKRIPVSSLVLPFLYGLSGIVCFFYSAEIYSASFQVISVFNPEYLSPVSKLVEPSGVDIST